MSDPVKAPSITLKVAVYEDRFIYSMVESEVNNIKTKMWNTIIDTYDITIREKLIEMGWTPPKTRVNIDE